MAATGRLGRPREAFDPGVQAEGYGAGILERCRFAAEQGRTPNGVVAFKLFAHHFDRVQRKIRLTEWFPAPLWVWIRRQDVLGQAISLAIALQTEAWSTALPAKAKPVYSRRKIMTRLDELASAEARWQVYFARNGIDPLVVWYEDLCAAPRSILDRIAERMEVEVEVPADLLTATGLGIQRNEVNAAWRARFLEEAKDPDWLDAVYSDRLPRILPTIVAFLRGHR